MPMKNNRECVKASYMWDIGNFAAIVAFPQTGFLVGSSFFNRESINESWRFHIYPNGRCIKDYIAFYVSKITISKETVYNLTLSIGRPNKTPVESHNYRGIRFTGGMVGEELFLHKKSNSWILRGPVRFRCDITEIKHKNRYLIHTPSFTSSRSFNLEDIASLSLDLEELLNIPFHSDLTVKMGGKETYIHKYMLFARCPNLISEFGYHEMKDVPSSVETQINDEIFEHLMHYIYTGKLRDSYVPFELFLLADSLRFSSLIRCLHEQVCSYHVCSEAETEEKIINWNLDELKFLEESSTCVHILQTTLYAQQLAVKVNISDGCEDEKFIDVSLKFLGVVKGNPIILICKLSITSEDGFHDFKEEQHVFLYNEQWNFPRISCRKDKYCYKRGIRLAAELIMYDWLDLLKLRNLNTKTLLFTNFQSVTDNFEHLRNCMNLLLCTAQSTSNLVLLSSDNQLFHVHDGIMFARWPGLRDLIAEDSDSSDEVVGFLNQMELNIPSEVLRILIVYLYTGFIDNFDRSKAEILLKYNSELEFPDHLVEECEDLLC